MTESLVSRADERDSHVFLGVQRAVHGVFSGDSTIVKPNVARSAFYGDALVLTVA